MKESKLPTVGAFVTICAFVYLAVFLTNNAISLNLATWLLWTVLDISIVYNMFKSNNPGKWTMTAFAAGAGIISALAIIQIVSGKTTLIWTSKETITLACFVAAFIGSLLSKNEDLAVNLGTTAMFIAGIPTLIDAWNNPMQQNVWFWGMCTAGCAITVLGTQWKFTKMYFPLGGAILNGFVTALAAGLIK